MRKHEDIQELTRELTREHVGSSLIELREFVRVALGAIPWKTLKEMSFDPKSFHAIDEAVDYETPVKAFILNCSGVDTLEKIADYCLGAWSKILKDVGYDTSDPPQTVDWENGGTTDIPVEGWLDKDIRRWATLRKLLIERIDAGAYQRLAREFDIEPEESDVYEWWQVSGWLADKLKAKGEVVGRLFGMDIWGRQTTGQSMTLDGVMQAIAKEDSK